MGGGVFWFCLGQDFGLVCSFRSKTMPSTCRKLHSAVHTCISEDAWPYIQKAQRRIGGKKTLNETPPHHANALTQQLCMHTTNHCAMTTSRRCAVDNSTSYNALSRKHNFAQNAVGLSHNASLLLGLLSRCRAVIRVFTSLPQHVIALKIHRNLTACSFF